MRDLYGSQQRYTACGYQIEGMLRMLIMVYYAWEIATGYALHIDSNADYAKIISTSLDASVLDWSIKYDNVAVFSLALVKRSD